MERDVGGIQLNNQIAMEFLGLRRRLVLNKSRTLLSSLLPFFLFYISIYGTLSIYVDSVAIRSIKDVVLFGIVIYGFIYCFKNKLLAIGIQLMYASLFVLSFASVLVSNDLVSLVYGVKITLLPMGMIFIGAILREKFNLQSILLVIYFTLTIGWLIEYLLGIEGLRSIGFEYGRDFEQFLDGQLRLPSTVGSPDNYALFIGLVGALLHGRLNGKVRAAFFVMTSVLVVLAAYRSGMVFWLVFVALTTLNGISNSRKDLKKLFIGVILIAASGLILYLPTFFATSSFASTESFQIRVSHWFSHLSPIYSKEGLVGNGLGTVGAASQRTADLGMDSTDYAVDNQYLGIYQQLGIVGVIYIVCFLGICFRKLYLNRATESISILAATLVTCITTSTLELFPFNVMMWLILGMAMARMKMKKAHKEPV